jgi:glycosyltransferase involved in cell wall biosynthesis
MKILMVSIFSQHFFNWTLQLEKSGHEVHWIDVYDSNTFVKKIDFVHQTVGWKDRLKYPGRYQVKKNFPRLCKLINILNQRKFIDVFETKLDDFQPDIVHSFVMYASTVPILGIMKKYPKIKWIYSAWGNDLYYYQNKKNYRQDMLQVLPSINYMFADCTRDYMIAKDLGFNGLYLGTFPTGGGYDLEAYNEYFSALHERKTIIIKGYEHKFGRCIKVLQAILQLKDELKNYKIKVFAANDKVFEFVKKCELSSMNNFQVYGRVSREEVLKLMGESLIYIGNSISDGMPNTLLEAIIMGAFPIQSNPGGATAELIEHEKNGILIQDPESSERIADIIRKALDNPELIKTGVNYNNLYIKPELERKNIQDRVLLKYKLVEQKLKA